MRAKIRNYKQHDDLYEVIGTMAADLGTCRTTLVELAVVDLARRLDEGEKGLKRKLIQQAREIDDERRTAGPIASLEARVRMGTAVRRQPVGS